MHATLQPLYGILDSRHLQQLLAENAMALAQHWLEVRTLTQQHQGLLYRLAWRQTQPGTLHSCSQSITHLSLTCLQVIRSGSSLHRLCIDLVSVYLSVCLSLGTPTLDRLLST